MDITCVTKKQENMVYVKTNEDSILFRKLVENWDGYLHEQAPETAAIEKKMVLDVQYAKRNNK